MDALLKSLSEVSILLLPFVGLLCLIFLAIFLYRLMVLSKALPDTIAQLNKTIETTTKAVENVDSTISTANGLVDKMNAPIDTIVGVSQTVDRVNGAANGIVSSVATYAIKNSDAVVNWSKSFFADRKEAKKTKPAETETETTSSEEDFGIYE